MPPGSKPKPPGQQKRPDKVKHPWIKAPGTGWDGPTPKPPADLSAAALRAWDAWFSSWWSAFWTPTDLPQLEQTIKIWDRVQRNELDPAKLTPLLDRWGLTPKGRQDLRWSSEVETPAEAPKADDELAKFRTERARGA